MDTSPSELILLDGTVSSVIYRNEENGYTILRLEAPEAGEEVTVVVIEHNLDVIKWADHVIDLGPEGGSGGGHVVCTGTPEEVAQCEASYTGRYLKKLLK